MSSYSIPDTAERLPLSVSPETENVDSSLRLSAEKLRKLVKKHGQPLPSSLKSDEVYYYGLRFLYSPFIERQTPETQKLYPILLKPGTTLENELWVQTETLRQLGVTAAQLATGLYNLVHHLLPAFESIKVCYIAFKPCNTEVFNKCPYTDPQAGSPKDCPYVHNAQDINIKDHLGWGEGHTTNTLLLHVAQAHGFFGGRGSRYYISVERLVRIIGVEVLRNCC